MISLKPESSSISGMYTAEKTPQAWPQDSLKFASRYLDGDSNSKIEAINHQTLGQTSKKLYDMEFLGVLKCLGI